MEAGAVGTLIIVYQARRTRFGCEWLVRRVYLAPWVVVLNHEHRSPEKGLVQELLAITQVFRQPLQKALDAAVSNLTPEPVT
jgi:predicted site-specific integrase-resolvase